MHEIGLCEGMVAAAVDRAAGREVTSVLVRAGVTHRIVPESMQLAWRTVAAGTSAEHATVELDVVPVQLHCHGCGAVSESTDPYAACPRCASTDLDAVGGDELMLVSMTLAAAATVADA